jgi:CheY-like chemotaxis protein
MPRPDPAAGATRRALVVEDDPDIVELLVHYLEREGFHVDTEAGCSACGRAATTCSSSTSSSPAWTG